MSICNKLLALASTVAVSAYAMVTLGDQEMGQVNARDGITLSSPAPAIQLHLASFSYQPTDDVVNVFATQPLVESLFDRHFELTASMPDNVPTDLSAVYKGGDVMAVTLTNSSLTNNQTLSVSVEQLNVGNSHNSLGAAQLNGIGLQGSRAWTWQH
jgi:hypothetical protein